MRGNQRDRATPRQSTRNIFSSNVAIIIATITEDDGDHAEATAIEFGTGRYYAMVNRRLACLRSAASTKSLRCVLAESEEPAAVDSGH